MAHFLNKTVRAPFFIPKRMMPADIFFLSMTRAIIKRLEKVPEMLAVVSRLIEEQLKRKGSCSRARKNLPLHPLSLCQKGISYYFNPYCLQLSM
jgi:hypothetical protein